MHFTVILYIQLSYGEQIAGDVAPGKANETNLEKHAEPVVPVVTLEKRFGNGYGADYGQGYPQQGYGAQGNQYNGPNGIGPQKFPLQNYQPDGQYNQGYPNQYNPGFNNHQPLYTHVPIPNYNQQYPNQYPGQHANQNYPQYNQFQGPKYPNQGYPAGNHNQFSGTNQNNPGFNPQFPDSNESLQFPEN